MISRIVEGTCPLGGPCNDNARCTFMCGGWFLRVCAFLPRRFLSRGSEGVNCRACANRYLSRRLSCLMGSSGAACTWRTRLQGNCDESCGLSSICNSSASSFASGCTAAPVYIMRRREKRRRQAQ
eukprot:TRINITY_DN68628_c0_g1_i1.p1 TRINITY_DN68628_c0_g1~~TRINITY_DN68628_c0_g1_i1.p1  ORF type:complete len:125 (-),score=14.06 TRINITY_DN68628_c0_g1_i1:130-504(-)